MRLYEEEFGKPVPSGAIKAAALGGFTQKLAEELRHFVATRTPNPDWETVEERLGEELLANRQIMTQLSLWPDCRCQYRRKGLFPGIPDGMLDLSAACSHLKGCWSYKWNEGVHGSLQVVLQEAAIRYRNFHVSD